ncbi:MAG: SDR family oxidoreductase, partial [Bacteroidetes bacterium]|nr:SDR family oxidoreductase [Bacteroidota bacterium]
MIFKGKSVLITGGSRGIGKAIAVRLAKEGANVAIASKTVEANAKIEGTIYTAAEEISAAGAAKVLPLQCDIRFGDQIDHVAEATAKEFGGIDILVNNASAINLSGTAQMEPKRFDLMHDINIRGTFFMSRACIPYLKKSTNAHILNLSPPISLDKKWFANHLAYTMSKFGMSMIVLGLSEEMKQFHIAANALWPKTTIATAAVKNLLGGDFLMQRSRTPEIVADAAYYILQKPSD